MMEFVRNLWLRKQAFLPGFLLPVFLASTIIRLHAQESNAQPQRLAWDAEIIQLAATLPVQDGGRVKPLDTFARFKLLKLNGRRVCYSQDQKRLSSIEWLLDCLFYPGVAMEYKVFLIQNDSVLDAIKMPHSGKKKRDRYAYTELFPSRSSLYALASDYSKVDEKERNPVQAQVVHLAENLMDFEWLIHYLDFARETLDIPSNLQLSKFFQDNSTVKLSHILKHSEGLKDYFFALRKEQSNAGRTEKDPEFNDMTKFLSYLDQITSRSVAIALFPQAEPGKHTKDWMTPADIVNLSFSGNVSVDQHIELLGLLENLYQIRDQRQEFKKKLIVFHSRIKELAEARGEYGKVPLEVTFYKRKFFYYALLVYVFGFLLVALSWLKPENFILNKLVPLTLVSGTLLLITGIVFRCVIRSRPPVSTLYESILFITAVAVVVALVIEYINRQKVGLAVGALLGTIGLFLANKYEIKEGSDTMTSLVAVLDSNYWLSTHVTTVTIGYAAGLLACIVAHIYIVGKMLGFRRNATDFYRGISGMVYGIICFGLFFSVVGTILGGIWANDSWGRFWGWDPKENGALMIILAELAMLHGRMGRYIRDLGICMSAIAIGCIVAFSWWGVNLLGVGLHSYGWTSGIFNSLLIFYCIEILVLVMGAFVWFREQGLTHTAPPSIDNSADLETQKITDTASAPLP